jgi:hypothetical protein
LFSFSFSVPVQWGGTGPEGSVVTEKEEEEEEKNTGEETESEDESPEETENPDEAPDESDEVPLVPEFLLYKIVSEREIIFEFSQPVMLTSLSFDPELEYDAIEEGSTVKVTLAEDPKPGLLITVDLLAEDEYGNSVDKQLSFRSRNNHVPDLQINELRTEWDSGTKKSEFIEFKMLSDGNLGALRVFVVGNTKNPQLYEFDPVEVKKDEYVVLHLRTLDSLCVDEFGDRLDESGGTDSSSTARDFWIPGSARLLRKTDAVYVLNQDDQVLDAVMIAETPDLSLTSTYLAEAAEFLFRQGAWKSAEAVDSSKTTTTQTICRDETIENTNTADNWYITVTSGATPGGLNNPKRYLK